MTTTTICITNDLFVLNLNLKNVECTPARRTIYYSITLMVEFQSHFSNRMCIQKRSNFHIISGWKLHLFIQLGNIATSSLIFNTLQAKRYSELVLSGFLANLILKLASGSCETSHSIYNMSQEEYNFHISESSYTNCVVYTSCELDWFDYYLFT